MTQRMSWKSDLERILSKNEVNSDLHKDLLDFGELFCHDIGEWVIIEEWDNARRVKCSCCGTTLVVNATIPFSVWCCSKLFCSRCGALLIGGSNGCQSASRK